MPMIHEIQLNIAPFDKSMSIPMYCPDWKNKNASFDKIITNHPITTKKGKSPYFAPMTQYYAMICPLSFK